MPICKQTEFAELCKVSRASVSQSISRQPAKLIATADGKIDTDHPINAAYLRKRLSDLKLQTLTTSKPSAAPKPKRAKTKPTPPKKTARQAPAAETQKPPKKVSVKKVAPSQVSDDEKKAAALADQKEREDFQKEVAKRELKRLKALAKAEGAPPAEDLDGDDDDDSEDDADPEGDDELTGLQIRKLLADIRNKEASTKRQEAALAILKGEYMERALFVRFCASLDSAIKTNVRDWPMRSAAKLEAMGRRGAKAKDFREYLELEMTGVIARMKSATMDHVKAEA